MATRYSKEKYAHIKGMKNEPLSYLALDSKNRKLHDEKGETVVSSSVQVIASSSIPSLKVTAIIPPTTCLKGKSEIRKSVWDDPATALG